MKIESKDILFSEEKKGSDIGGKGSGIMDKEFNLSFSTNKDAIKQKFFSETFILIESGVDLKNCLEIIIEGTTKNKERELFTKILKKVISGCSLSDAMKSIDIFNKYDYFSVRAGEESGSMEPVLSELSAFYEKKILHRRQIISSLTYPALVLLTTVASLVFMLNYVVPMFRDVFARFKGDLPPITKFIINLSSGFTHYLIIIFLFGSFLIIAGFLNRNKLWFRKYSTTILLRVPIAGKIIGLTYNVRFCQTMRLLTTSRVHLLKAIELLSQVIDFYPMEIALISIKDLLAKGHSLSDSMARFPIFDRKMISLTKVAEEVNKLDVIYDQLYKQYSNELDQKIKTMNNILEPILIIFVGIIVAFILISMYLPIFQIGTNLS